MPIRAQPWPCPVPVPFTPALGSGPCPASGASASHSHPHILSPDRARCRSLPPSDAQLRPCPVPVPGAARSLPPSDPGRARCRCPVLTRGRSRSAAPGAAQPRRARRFRPPPRAPDVRTARGAARRGRGFGTAAARLAGGAGGVVRTVEGCGEGGGAWGRIPPCDW